MSRPENCPVCGAVLPADRLSGLCPACTWNGLFAPDNDSPPPAPGLASAPLMRLPGYELLEEIARGGMGIVYRARQLEPHRTVALKMLLPQQLGSPEMAQRFRLEVRALTELEHPAILPVHHTGEHDGLPFFTMKLATGGTLAQRKAQLVGNWREIAALMATLADAVQFAHDRGVLHRDLKPSNILFDEQNRPYVSDFGLAKLANADTDLTRSVDFLGTPHYVAPEIATRSARQATTASDIYSLGAILYELLCGSPPFEAESVPALLKKIVEEDPALKSQIESVPQDLEVICLKCLEKEPQRRYGSARALADDLRRWLGGEPILARPVTTAERAWKWMRRNPVLSTLTAALMLSLIGGGFGLWRSYREVRSALKATRNAENQAQQSLREALLAQSRALGAAHASGQRWAAVDALARAARIEPSLELRNEAATALARPDLREVKRFAANISPMSSSVVFTSDLESYFVSEATGGFTLRSTKDQKVIASFPDASRKPARWFVVSPNDREVAAVMNDYRVEVWPVGAAEPRLTLAGSQRQPASAEFHPNGVTVAGYVSGEGAFLQKGDKRQPLVSTNNWAIFMRFDPAGERLAVVRDPGGVEMWRCTGEPKLLWFQPILRTVPWLAWSPDGRKLAAAADDGRGIRIFSADDGQTELVYSQHLLYPRQFEFDPSGRMIASMGQDWALRLWDARTGQDLVTGVGRHRVMRFSRDGRRLSTSPTDRDLAILELAPEEVFHEFRTTPSSEIVIPSRLVRSADGRWLAAAHPQIRLYDIARAEEIGLLPPSFATFKQVFFETSGSATLSSVASDSTRTGALLCSIFGKGIYRLPFSFVNGPNEVGCSCQWGKEELVANHTNAIIWNAVEDGRTWMRHGSDGVEIWPERDHSQARRLAIRAPLEKLATSPDGRWAAAPDYARQRVTICDCRSGQITTNLPAPGIDQIWFSPDSHWLVASLASGYCTWETETWRRTASWTAHLDSGNPGEIAFSDDGRLVAARQEREVFRLLTFPDCKELVTLKPPLVISFRSASLSADGRRLWLLGSGYRLFEWNLGQLRSELAKLGLDWE